MGIKRKLHVAALMPVVLYKTWRDQSTAAKKWKAYHRDQTWQEQTAKPHDRVFVPEPSKCRTSSNIDEAVIWSEQEDKQDQKGQFQEFTAEEIAEARRGKKAQTRGEESDHDDDWTRQPPREEEATRAAPTGSLKTSSSLSTPKSKTTSEAAPVADTLEEAPSTPSSNSAKGTSAADTRDADMSVTNTPPSSPAVHGLTGKPIVPDRNTYQNPTVEDESSSDSNESGTRIGQQTDTSSNQEDLHRTFHGEEKADDSSDAEAASNGLPSAETPDELEKDNENTSDDDFGGRSKPTSTIPKDYVKDHENILNGKNIQLVKVDEQVILPQFHDIVIQVEDDDIFENALVVRQQDWPDDTPFPSDMTVDFLKNATFQTERYFDQVLEFSDGVEWIIRFPANGTELTRRQKKDLDEEWEKFDELYEEGNNLPRTMCWAVDVAVLGSAFILMEYDAKQMGSDAEW